MLRRLSNALAMFGLDLPKSARAVRGLRPYFANRAAYRRLDASRHFPAGKTYPCLGDRFEQSGVAGGHYFHQDLYVAQRVLKNNPRRHVDVGSRVDGFVAHVAVFRPIEVFDIRPLRTSARNITFRQADLMDRASAPDACTDSLSCLHTLEHFGLGRYGDPVDPEGYRKGWDTLHRMLEPGGRLYFSVPMGERQRVEFDAHRVFSLPFLLSSMIEGRYRVLDFAYVDDAGELHAPAPLEGPEAQRSFGQTYGCAIFELHKL